MRRCLSLGAILLCLSGCQRAVSSETELETVQEVVTEQEISDEQEKILEDIQMIKQAISDSPCSNEYFQADLDALMKEVAAGDIDRERCYQRIREIISSCHCAHLNIWTKSDDPIYANHANCLPIKLKWFGDELRIAVCMEEKVCMLNMMRI